MNKFQSVLKQSSKDIKANRARIASENAKDAAEEMVRKLRKDLRNYESQLDNLTDLNRDSELSLKVIRDDFNAGNWMSTIQNVKVAIANKKIELAIAEETFEEWFSEFKEDSDSKQEPISKKAKTK